MGGGISCIVIWKGFYGFLQGLWPESVLPNADLEAHKHTSVHSCLEGPPQPREWNSSPQIFKPYAQCRQSGRSRGGESDCVIEASLLLSIRKIEIWSCTAFSVLPVKFQQKLPECAWSSFLSSILVNVGPRGEWSALILNFHNLFLMSYYVWAFCRKNSHRWNDGRISFLLVWLCLNMIFFFLLRWKQSSPSLVYAVFCFIKWRSSRWRSSCVCARVRWHAEPVWNVPSNTSQDLDTSSPVHVELEGRTMWVTRDFTAASSRVKLRALTGSHSNAALLSNVLAPSFTGGKVQLWWTNAEICLCWCWPPSVVLWWERQKKKGLPDWGRYNILNQDESVIPLHHESDLKASSLYFIFNVSKEGRIFSSMWF